MTTMQGWKVTLTSKTVNAIRCCRACNHIRTFTYVKTAAGDLVRGVDGFVVSYQEDSMFGGSLTPAALRCPACGGLEKVNLVTKVRVTKHECNGKCMASKSGVCECSCGGKNHGMAYAA